MALREKTESFVRFVCAVFGRRSQKVGFFFFDPSTTVTTARTFGARRAICDTYLILGFFLFKDGQKIF